MEVRVLSVLLLCLFSHPGDDALPNGLDVTFEVTELRRVTGSYNTMVGNNEGSMVGLSVPPRRDCQSHVCTCLF